MTKTSRILHLADLHLGEKGKQELGDYKHDIVEPAHRQQRLTMLRWTLRRIGDDIRKRDESLGAIVMTGDFTTAYDERGFELFAELLEELGDACPPPERIVVMPGNHDVERGSPPGSEARYKLFKKHIKSAGYVCSILDGSDEDGTSHLLVDEEAGWVIVPINSSNWSQSMVEPPIDPDLWSRLGATVESELDSDARELFDHLCLHDAARVDETQLETLRRELDEVDDGLVRIAALHHHLLPVSALEEAKTFESIIDLGLLRGFLRDNRIELVLHGHKHTSNVYWDEIASPPEPDPSPPRRVLVVSGATISQGDQREACRMIEVATGTAAPGIEVKRIAGVAGGQKLRPVSLGKKHFWRVPSLDEVERWNATVVSGRTAGATYERLREVIGDRDTLDERIYNLVCHVEDGPSATQLPPRYPPIEQASTDDERQEWFEDQVKWWQHKRSIQEPMGPANRRVLFTHGDRIHARSAPALNGEGVDEDRTRLDVAIAALGPDFPKSGRGIVPILDPSIDCVDADDRSFPAFCSVQFLLRSEGGLRLDVVGYFRKQELLYWWPVNMAELAMLQERVLGELARDELGEVKPGCLTTFAALAHVGTTTAPRVAIPVIDRLHDEEKNHDHDKDRLWDLAYGLTTERDKWLPDPDAWLQCWEAVLEDLDPGPFTAAGVPVALEGLAALVRRVRVVARYHGGAVGTIRDNLEAVLEANKVYAQNPSKQTHGNWRRKVQPRVAAVKQALASLDSK